MTCPVKFHEIQGNILSGYRSGLVRHFILEVKDRGSARRFLGASVTQQTDTPKITHHARKNGKRPELFVNLGITYEGLRALGVPDKSLATFPTEFIEGMAARAVKLGDVGLSAPETWAPPFDKPALVHVIVSAYADDPKPLDRVQDHVSASFNLTGIRDGRRLDDDKVFFGFTDNISNLKFAGVHDADQDEVKEPLEPLGTALLGHPTRLEGIRFRVPEPPELGLNGSFNAFRILAQDVAGFEAYLDSAAEELLPQANVLLPPCNGDDATRLAALREFVAAQMCGRWRDGTPVALSPRWPDTSVPRTDFDYLRDTPCPAGAHIRRSNPRNGKIVQRIANGTRRLVRRGMSYGPDFDPPCRDCEERGLLGNFIGASLGAQFEAVMCDWLNLGLQDPNITGSNCPLLGANTPETSWFDLSLPDGGSIRLRGFPRFVTARGGAYTFLPSLPAIRYLSKLTG